MKIPSPATVIREKQVLPTSTNVVTEQRSTRVGDHLVNYYVTRPSASTPIMGLVIGSHGLKSNAQAQFLTETVAEHGGLAEKLAAQGYVVYFADLPSFGQSPGRTDKLFNITAPEATETLVEMAKLARADYPKHRLALYGHSFGGALVLSEAVRSAIQADAIIAEAPAVAPRNALEAISLSQAKLPASLGLGNLPVPVLGDFDVSQFTDVPAVREKMLNDPHITAAGLKDNVTLNTSATVANLMGEFKNPKDHHWDAKTPVYIVHSKRDEVTNPNGSEELVKTLNGLEVQATFLPVSVAAHNPANSSIADAHARQVIQWLDQSFERSTP